MDAMIMRQAVMDAYGGTNWKKRVRQMPEHQIIAVYYSLKKQGKIK